MKSCSEGRKCKKKYKARAFNCGREWITDGSGMLSNHKRNLLCPSFLPESKQDNQTAHKELFPQKAHKRKENNVSNLAQGGEWEEEEEERRKRTMEGRSNQPWGNGASFSASAKVEPSNKPTNPNFDHLFEGLQATKEEQGGRTFHMQNTNMNNEYGTSTNPFDSPPPADSASPTSRQTQNQQKTRTRALCSSFVEVLLRVMVIVLLFLAFILIASDFKSTRVPNALGQDQLKFTCFDAFKYLLSASMIACGFSTIQLIPELYRMYTGEVLVPEEFILYFNFITDQVIAYLLLSSTSAGMTASELVRNGYNKVWPSLCSGNGFWSFCAQAAASVSMSFFAFLIMASLALLSGYRLAKYLVFA
ncbi:hypothetical protein SUGI_0783530 [Cryptomeria japonica]|uniref:CASP-like protein 4C2 n=1 Tax=Cryptomeria japonica TaxID=3369 RepID=UPI00241470E6|nr:CASP-like protein 4C2 [Cryptomeria japonica]GLJ38467.1 hypothetical protein SUGI_0783530 [Cryptomeria japonica]